jgi:hypothetical protein
LGRRRSIRERFENGGSGGKRNFVSLRLLRSSAFSAHRDDGFAVAKAVQRRDLALEAAGNLANVGLNRGVRS